MSGTGYRNPQSGGRDPGIPAAPSHGFVVFMRAGGTRQAPAAQADSRAAAVEDDDDAAVAGGGAPAAGPGPAGGPPPAEVSHSLTPKPKNPTKISETLTRPTRLRTARRVHPCRTTTHRSRRYCSETEDQISLSLERRSTDILSPGEDTHE